MALVKWDPFGELEGLSDRLNRLMSRSNWPTRSEEALIGADWAPAVDIQETDKEFVIKAELPEVKKDDVKVTVQNGTLTITGERKSEKEEKGKKFHRVEWAYGSFSRSFTLPDDADADKVAGDFKDGVLRVHVPKSEKAKPKKIDVKVG